MARAGPDGYTILLSPAAMIANAAFGVNVPCDIDKHRAPVVRFADLPVLLAASNDAPAKAQRAETLIADGGTISVQVLNEFAGVASRKQRMRRAEIEEPLMAVRSLCRVEPLAVGRSA